VLIEPYNCLHQELQDCIVHLQCSGEEVSVPVLVLAPRLKVAEEGVELAVGVPLQMPAARFKSVTESAIKILQGVSAIL
jgi:hypothetical protein